MTDRKSKDGSMPETESPALPFTGERFTPECVREIWYEHWHRYVFASRLAAGKRVLDAACGEGYGAALLARTAANVLGVDIDAASIAHARERYGARTPNLAYEQRDATRLDFAPGSFDLVVSFETLEHVDAQERLLDGFSRVLADDGVLVISSPDRHAYSEVAGFRNEFHTRELDRGELLGLLKPRFADVRLYGQKLLFQSAIWSEDAQQGFHEAWTGSASPDAPVAAKLDYAPLYFVAVCAKRALPEHLPVLSLFGDREESVYAHYNHEVQKNMSAGARIGELERELDALRSARTTPDAASATARRDWRWWRRKSSA
jgi:SAM-dependent methyltransferase